MRPAFTLGGSGGGIAEREEELRDIVERGIKGSPIHQVLLERSVAGWKEIEFEVVRDAADRALIVCAMENVDPIGIHTGDSIVVAPTQTLSDAAYARLRRAALAIIRALRIEGGCNVQFALSPDESEYYVIEVNPRVSRSSALASKATGYPIARVAAKIAVGLHLNEIGGSEGGSGADTEPVLDYCAVKFPRWPFDKFATANRQLGTQMKATGEVLALDRTFEGALQKAVRSLEIGLDGLNLPELDTLSPAELEQKMGRADDERIFAVAEAFRRGMSVQRVHELTRITPWFLEGIARIVEAERRLAERVRRVPWTDWGEAEVPLVRQAKELGFSDSRLGRLLGVDPACVRAWRKARGSCRYGARTYATDGKGAAPYYYSTYAPGEDEPASERPNKVIVLGSGPIRIGQGIEFDYCSVHSVWALQQAGYEAIIINNNPETVSTDFDTSDKLYFEPLTLEDVLNVVEREQPLGVVVQFGGQTAINLAGPLHEAGVPILGTSVESIDLAEDRDRFEQLLRSLGIPQTEGRATTSFAEAMGVALKIGFPLVVRPSYVLGGRAKSSTARKSCSIHENGGEGQSDHPVLVDQYLRTESRDVVRRTAVLIPASGA